MLHGPNDAAAHDGGDAKNREQPPITNRADDRRSDHSSYTTEYVPHKIVDGHTVGRLPRHKLRQHGRHHAENEHRADPEEEIGDHLSDGQSGRKGAQSRLTGQIQCTPFCAVHPYHTRAIGYMVAPSQAFSNILSSGW